MLLTTLLSLNLLLALPAPETGAFKELLAELKDPDFKKRAQAAKELGEMGVEAKAAIPALIGALKYASDKVCARGCLGLEANGARGQGSHSRPDRDAEGQGRGGALRGGRHPGRLGPTAKAAIPALSAGLEDRDSGPHCAECSRTWAPRLSAPRVDDGHAG